MSIIQTRRQLLTTLSMAGAAVTLPFRRAVAIEPPPETTIVRLPKLSVICFAPQYVCEALLRAEGFTDIRYIDSTPETLPEEPGSGRVDFAASLAVTFIRAVDNGAPITVLSGVHAGCYELFAQTGIRSIADLKGKSVGIQALGSNPHVLLTLLAAQVGLDPSRDIHWVTDPSVKPIERFVDGKIDAFLGFPPEPQELHARHIGNVIVNTAVDRPWSQYFCCMLGGHRDYVRNNPIATKRVLRAVLKAADLCSADPARAARGLVDDGFTAQ